MNAKLCKALRRAARRATVGMDDRELVHGRRGSAINHPQTFRGVYRDMKKRIRAANRASGRAA